MPCDVLRGSQSLEASGPLGILLPFSQEYRRALYFLTTFTLPLFFSQSIVFISIIPSFSLHTD